MFDCPELVSELVSRHLVVTCYQVFSHLLAKTVVHPMRPDMVNLSETRGLSTRCEETGWRLRGCYQGSESADSGHLSSRPSGSAGRSPINTVMPWLTSTSQSDAKGSLPKSFRQNRPDVPSSRGPQNACWQTQCTGIGG